MGSVGSVLILATPIETTLNHSSEISNCLFICSETAPLTATTRSALFIDVGRTNLEYNLFRSEKFSGMSRGCRSCIVTAAGLGESSGRWPPKWCTPSTPLALRLKAVDSVSILLSLFLPSDL